MPADLSSPDGRTLAELAALVGGEVVGDDARIVDGVAPLAEAKSSELGFLASRRYLKDLDRTEAGALLVSEAFGGASSGPPDRVVVPDAHLALAELLDEWFPPPPKPAPGIHESATIAPEASLGEDVSLGPGVVVAAGARVGDRTVLEAQVSVGAGCIVGADCHLYSHATLYPGSELGDRVIVHAGARIGVDGFGYVWDGKGHRKIRQVGRAILEDDVEVGANVCIDKGALGDTVIGRGTKIDNLVHVAHNVRVGPHVLMAAQVGIAGSTRIGAGVAMGGQAGVAGHLSVGDGARLTAQAGVDKDVPAGETWTGFPARPVREFFRSMGHFYRLPAYARTLRALADRGRDEERDGA